MKIFMLTAATVGVSGQTLLYYFGDDLGMRLLWTSPHQFVSSLIPTNKIPACRAKKNPVGPPDQHCIFLSL